MLNPIDMESIIASGADVTEANPFTPHAQGMSLSLRFSRTSIPLGNIQPRKNETGISISTVTIYRQNVPVLINRFRMGSEKSRINAVVSIMAATAIRIR